MPRIFGSATAVVVIAVFLMSGCASRQVRQSPAPDAPETGPGHTTHATALARRAPPHGSMAGFDGEPRRDAAAEGTRPGDLWARLRSGFALDHHVDQPAVAAAMARYRADPSNVARLTERAAPFLHYIVEAVENARAPLELALLPAVESGFEPHAYSHGRAAGLWQFIPSTGAAFGLAQNWWYDGRRDIHASTGAALAYLTELEARFDGDWLLALAAYNCGAGNVSRAIARNRKEGRPTDFWSLELPSETSVYVPRLLALAALVDAPKTYGVALARIPDRPRLRRVVVDTQIELDLAAELAAIDADTLRRFNPGFNRWATPPDGPHALLLPVAKVAGFQARLDELPTEQRVRWTRYRIRSGDTLSGIAREHHTTVAALREVNRIPGHRIRAGSHLLIPAGGAPVAAKRDTPLEYRVAAGDTLWGIARAHNVSLDRLTEHNGLSDPTRLRPGEEIFIPAVTRTTGASPVSSKAAPTRRIRYTVRSGDSLWGISRRFRVSVAQLRKWNNMESRALLRPGQRLTLYVDTTRQSESI